MVPLLVESCTGDLSAPLLLTLLLRGLLRSARTYQLTWACRTRARSQRSSGLRISLQVLLGAQKWVHTHLLHLLVRQVPNVYQKQIHSHGQLYTPYPIVPSEPVRVYAVTRELRPQTNLAKPLQPYLVTTLHHQPAVTPALRAPRPAAPLPRVLPELSESTPFAPVRVPALELRRSQQGDHCMGLIQLGLLTDFDAAGFTAPPALSAPCPAVPLPRVLLELSESVPLAPVRVPALELRRSQQGDHCMGLIQLGLLTDFDAADFTADRKSVV